MRLAGFLASLVAALIACAVLVYVRRSAEPAERAAPSGGTPRRSGEGFRPLHSEPIGSRETAVEVEAEPPDSTHRSDLHDEDLPPQVRSYLERTGETVEDWKRQQEALTRLGDVYESSVAFAVGRGLMGDDGEVLGASELYETYVAPALHDRRFSPGQAAEAERVLATFVQDVTDANKSASDWRMRGRDLEDSLRAQTHNIERQIEMWTQLDPTICQRISVVEGQLELILGAGPAHGYLYGLHQGKGK
jgi:hypothetical protein